MKEASVGGHDLSAQARVLLNALAEEVKAKVITWSEYGRRAKEIVKDDKATCRRECCGRKPRRKP